MKEIRKLTIEEYKEEWSKFGDGTYYSLEYMIPQELEYVSFNVDDVQFIDSFHEEYISMCKHTSLLKDIITYLYSCDIDVAKALGVGGKRLVEYFNGRRPMPDELFEKLKIIFQENPNEQSLELLNSKTTHHLLYLLHRARIHGYVEVNVDSGELVDFDYKYGESCYLYYEHIKHVLSGREHVLKSKHERKQLRKDKKSRGK